MPIMAATIGKDPRMPGLFFFGALIFCLVVGGSIVIPHARYAAESMDYLLAGA